MQNTRPEVINTHVTVSSQIYAKGCAARYQFFPTIILAKLSHFFSNYCLRNSLLLK